MTALKSLARVPRPTEHCPSSQKADKRTKNKTGSFFLQLILFCTKAWHALPQVMNPNPNPNPSNASGLCLSTRTWEVRERHQKCEKEELPHKEKLDSLRLASEEVIIEVTESPDPIIPELGGTLWSCWGQILQFHLQRTADSGWGVGSSSTAPSATTTGNKVLGWRDHWSDKAWYYVVNIILARQCFMRAVICLCLPLNRNLHSGTYHTILIFVLNVLLNPLNFSAAFLDWIFFSLSLVSFANFLTILISSQYRLIIVYSFFSSCFLCKAFKVSLCHDTCLTWVGWITTERCLFLHCPPWEFR